MVHRLKLDLQGKCFGDWTVLSEVKERRKRRVYWLCKCVCGTVKPVWSADLSRGSSMGCGCTSEEKRIAIQTTHGMSYHPAYNSWRKMKSRCYDKNLESYPIYGGRGIKVCEEWLQFSNFWRDMGPSFKMDCTLDRIDPNGDYCLANCRWATPRQQGSNKRNNVWVDTPAGRMTVSEAARHYKVGRSRISERLRKGKPISDLFN